MNTLELIEALDNRYGNPLAPDCALIQEGIKQLRFLNEENNALRGDIAELVANRLEK